MFLRGLPWVSLTGSRPSGPPNSAPFPRTGLVRRRKCIRSQSPMSNNVTRRKFIVKGMGVKWVRDEAVTRRMRRLDSQIPDCHTGSRGRRGAAISG